MGREHVTPPGKRQLWLVTQSGQRGRHTVAEVAINQPVSSTRSYAVPAELVDVVRPGARVRVPYGRGSTVCDGICLRVTEGAWDHTRPPIIDAQPGAEWARPDLVELGEWISQYYVASPWKTFATIWPRALHAGGGRKVRMLQRTAATPDGRITPQQQALLDALREAPVERRAALDAAGVSDSVLRGLIRRGLVEQEERREQPAVGGGTTAGELPHSPEDDYELTPGQAAALERIRTSVDAGDTFGVYLLYGVPGSGKTEVYVRVMRSVVAGGRQAIMLIPEIALTTQLIERLERRFARVGVLHSALTERARRETLSAIASGEVDVVIGTRTAVFAPCPRLGLIVVDEEQEGSFKNLAAPYYHARDVAIKRGQLLSIPVVLGSGTPALESWENAHSRAHFELLRLPERVPGAELPQVRAVQLDAAEEDAGQVLSTELRRRLRETVEAGHQAILLHNRRGYAVHLRCRRCRTPVVCERCGVHVVYHRAEDQVKCHRCGWQGAVPKRCLDSTCDGEIERMGLAIQRLEEDLRATLPSARLLRLDSDTMRRRDDYEAALRGFESGAADILIGTQMVAKGLDFPGVRLVGVIDADAALTLPDFRAAERVFQLVVQVVGRAGRRAGASLALVQSQGVPPVLRDALGLDYEPFAERELTSRRKFFYPPYARLVRVVCADERPGRARVVAEEVAQKLEALAGRVHAGLRVGRATPCVIPQLRELHRYEVLIRGPRGGSVQQLLQVARDERVLRGGVRRWMVDVDPIDLL